MTFACQSPWINWSGTQHVYADVERPTTLPALQALVRDVSARGGRLKPVATGLSFSDILQSDDTLVDMTGLLGEPATGALLPLEQELFHHPPRSPLVRIPAGARIRTLNGALAKAGLAFTNLGGYDGQTFVGAVSTSTHGSGLGSPPLCDGVRSLDLLTAKGALLRLEPSVGLTNPAAFEHRYGSARTLIQDDQLFWSAVVSLGCLGIVLSLVASVSPAYRLVERRRLRSWSEVVRSLDGGVLSSVRNYEVLVNPYRRRDGDYSCLTTERWVAEPERPTVRLPADRRSAESTTFLASSQEAVVALMNTEPRLIPGLLEAGLAALVTGADNHVEDSFLIYNIGKINTAHVLSGEYFYPLAGGLHLRAARALFELVERNRSRGIHQPSPLSLRFMAGSQASLSMARVEPHCAIEIAVFSGSHRGSEALLEYERLCLALGGRPHWGQLNELTGQAGWAKAAYPRFETFKAVRRYLDPNGLFRNHFTERLGLS